MFLLYLIWVIFFRFSLSRKVLKFWSNQIFGWECTCHTSLKLFGRSIYNKKLFVRFTVSQVTSSFATFRNIIEVSKTGTFQRNISTIFLKVLNIYLFSKIFQKVEIVMLRWNILQYLTKMLRQHFNCNKTEEIFLTSFCNILCYVGNVESISQNFCKSKGSVLAELLAIKSEKGQIDPVFEIMEKIGVSSEV